jgi:ribulose-phosphate 3-epimerase
MSMQPPILAPSILAADFSRLGNQIQSCIKAGSRWIHCDIMDGHFVPNISFGANVVQAARGKGDFLLDVHLMISHPEEYIQQFAEAGADLITVHQEACPHLHRVIQQIKKAGCKAGVAINPATPLSQISLVSSMVDLLLIMSVNPGFGGQAFIDFTYEKLQKACLLRQKQNASFLIEVDGGVNQENIHQITKAGADVFVAGSSVFGSSDISKNIKKLTENMTANDNLYI